MKTLTYRPQRTQIVTTPAIETDQLTKSYGSTVAVDGLTLSIERGTIYGFLGPNGAGKSTTMRMLTGLIEPTSGAARVAGVPIGDHEQLVKQIGFLPETPPLYEELTGREQLRFAADLRGADWSTVEDRALSLCDRLGLRSDLDQRIDGYSKGMKQKVAFVQATQHGPAVVFLDEPTSGLDPRAARSLREVIVDLASDDTTVFLSTHILPVVEEIADHIGVLNRGQLAGQGSPATIEAGFGDGADLEDVFLQLTGGAGDGLPAEEQS